MNTFKIFMAMVLLWAGFGMQGCKHCLDASDPDCDNYDPCYGQHTIDTYFKVRDGDNGFPPPPKWCLDMITYCDTFLSSSVRLTVPKGNPHSTYEWRIGDDSTVRTVDEFEISFEDDLKEYGWERFYPVTLTIHTPYTSCLDNPADTLVVVTRNIFFTEKQYNIFDPYADARTFEGFFSDKPNDKAQITLFWNDSFDFRG
ncbi:MAG: hypothetical protein H6607_04370 [Flavobacteriales bacterium]|nr:hypothetical protein [Flavobacteriales bacterium]